jgi:prolyl-tRNA synthetase
MLTDEEVKSVTGANPGSCGPVGLKIPVYLDKGVEGLKNYVVGANKDGFHLKNVNHGRDFRPTAVADLRLAKAGDKSPDGGTLKTIRGIEVGHIFYLGTVYSSAMKANFLNASGQLEPIQMGCYGIGISRTVQAVIEQSHDKDGIVWPMSIAPFPVHICLLDPGDAKVAGVAQSIYEELSAKGIECFMDDRDERPGVKFKDADLLGMPLRLNVGGRGVAAGEVELIQRKSKEMQKLPIDQAVQAITKLVVASGLDLSRAHLV